MPITFTPDHVARIIHTYASGTISVSDILAHLDRKQAAGLLSYEEVFDARDTSLDLSIAELHQIATEVRRVMGARKGGRIAVVTDSAFIRGLAQTYAALTFEDHPDFEVFESVEQARAWVEPGWKEAHDGSGWRGEKERGGQGASLAG